MCNLYRLAKEHAEVARHFRVRNALIGANLPAQVYPGYPGAVVAGGELRQMTWGFPLARKGAKGQPLKPRPVNNARSDKLDSYMWRHSFADRRCLIPLTAWAEAEGDKGAKTRTWMSVKGEEVFAAAGIWRTSDEWGDVYSMVMTDAAGAAAEVHDRMPVLLAADDWDAWTDGSADEARGWCGAYGGEVRVERTKERWSRA